MSAWILPSLECHCAGTQHTVHTHPASLHNNYPSYAKSFQRQLLSVRQGLASERAHQRSRNQCRRSGVRQSGATGAEILFQMTTEYNEIMAVQFPPDDEGSWGPLSGCKCLILDKKVNSVFRQGRLPLGKGFYWEQMALIAELAPEGPIGILGLGSGTIAELMHRFWPERKLHGWELDSAVLFVARQHMGLQALEDSGALISHVGDALSAEASADGGFAGIVVDLFAAGDVIGSIRKEETWQDIRRKLRPGGVCIVNLGESEDCLPLVMEAFAGEAQLVKRTDLNTLVLLGAGGPIDSASLPGELAHTAEGWAPVGQR